MRTIIDVPDDQLERLDAHCRAEGISRAEAIRRAVDAHLRVQPGSAPAAFGLWAGRRLNGLDYENRVRREWPREMAGTPPARRPTRQGRKGR